MSGMADSFVRTLSVFHNYLKSAELGEGAGGGGGGSRKLPIFTRGITAK